ncbi:MAG: hypothetical protein JWP78_861 [Mucilaginibacter sp.]|nr:hypothetical protein [Mucilaginibacter sp.]
MRKLGLLALLCFLLTQLKAQNGVVFKIKYLPGHNYQTSVNMSMKLNVNLNGDTAFISKLKSQGITAPVNANLAIGINGNIKTGASGADNTFPLNMDYKVVNLTVNANGKDVPIPPKATEKDIKIMGHITQDGKIKIDSAEGKKINDTTEKKIQQMMDMIQKQIQFPDRPLKPGDTFTQSAPTNIPISGDNNIQLNGGITYKLLSMSGGKAYFDMVPNFGMSFKIRTMGISVTGTGTGKMVYSIKDNFPLSKDGSFNMRIKVTSDQLNVDGTAVITSNYSCTIN